MYYRLLVLLLPIVCFGQEQRNITLLDNWKNDNLMVNSTKVRYNECWAFEREGQEYAIIGSTEGTHFFLISAESKLAEVDFIPGLHQASTVIHRDFKTFGNYVYAVCDEGYSSLQIIDISYLPDSVVLVNELPDEIARAHNLTIDEPNELMYVSLPQYLNTGILTPRKFAVYSLSDPVNPTLIWEAPPTFPYVHDCYVRDNIAYLSCGDDGLRIYDFSNPASPVYLQNLNFYQDQGYNHQGWMTPDGKHFVFGDENNGARLKLCDVAVNHELTISNYFGTAYQDGSVPHNVMLSNDFAYVAYYNQGFRIYDIRNVPVEIAWYDTYPEEAEFQMNGAWGVYSDLPSGRIVVSDRQNGLFLFDFREEVFDGFDNDDLTIYPNPSASGTEMIVKLNLSEFTEVKIQVLDLFGHKLLEEDMINSSFLSLTPALSQGSYFLRAIYTDYLGEEHMLKKKFIVL